MKINLTSSNNNNRNKKFVSLILSVLIVVAAVALYIVGTFAYKTSYARNEEMTGEVLTTDTIKGENIGPILDYLKDGVSSVMTVVNPNSSITYIGVTLSVTSISDNLKDAHFKYAILTSTDETFANCSSVTDATYSDCQVADNGDFTLASNDQTIILATGIQIPQDEEVYVKAIFYIDGTDENAPNLMENELTGKLYINDTSTFKLTYDCEANGGTCDGTTIAYIENGTTVDVTPPAALKSGYELTGWYSEVEGGSKILNADGSFSGNAVDGYTTATTWALTENKTLYARYADTTIPMCTITTTDNLKATTQTLTLSCSDNNSITSYYYGTKSSPSSSDYQTIESQAILELEQKVSSSGTYYIFVKDESGNISESVSQTYNTLTIYNMYSKSGPVSVDYSTNSYSLSDTAKTYLLPTNTSFSPAEVYSIPTSYASDSTFIGYRNTAASTTSAELTGTSSEDSLTLTTNSSYSFWWSRDEYTVHYDANGGSGEPNNQTKYKGINLTLSSTTPTSTSGNFSNWNTEVDGSGTSYAAGSSYTTDSDLTLYAQWSGGSGTFDDPYIIGYIEDLLDLSLAVDGGEAYSGKYYKLTRDLDFASDSDGSYGNPYRTDYGDINGDGTVSSLITELTTGTGWEPIGYYNNGDKDNIAPFSGYFNGNGYKLKNLYINNNIDKEFVGLFAYVDGGSITNLGISGTIINSDDVNTNSAGLIASSANASIDNCYSEVNITSNYMGYSIGGLVSNAIGTTTITNSYNAGNISGSRTSAGLVSYLATGVTVNISNSYNTGTITNDIGNYAGGLVGRTETGGTINISNSYNLGNVSSSAWGTVSSKMLGGLVGEGTGTINISDSYNSGNISSTVSDNSYEVSVGGLVGRNVSTGEISNSYNYGKVSGGNRTGGIIGFVINTINYSSTDYMIINNVFNSGSISSSYEDTTHANAVGGLVGYVSNSNFMALNSFNSGTISHSAEMTLYISGLIGLSNTSNTYIINSYNAGNVTASYTGSFSTGVLSSYTSDITTYINNVYNVGTISGGNTRGVAYIKSSTTRTLTLTNAYYNSNSNSVGSDEGTTTAKTRTEINTTTFSNLLNTNKNAIILSSINSAISSYSLSSWNLSTILGYPIFDWAIGTSYIYGITMQSSCTSNISEYDTYYTSYYNTLAEAFDGASDGSRVCVLLNASDTSIASLSDNKTIILDFNGNTIDESSNEGTAITVSAGTTLTLTGSGGINATSYTTKHLIINAGGTLNIGTSSSDALVINRTKATSHSTDDYYIISTNSTSYTTAITNINGGTITGNDRIIYTNAGQLNISGGTIENTRDALTSYDSDTGCTNSYTLIQYADISSGTISGGTIKYTNPDYCSRALFLNSEFTGTVNITGGTLKGYVQSNSTVTDALILGIDDGTVNTSPVIDASSAYYSTSYRHAIIFNGTDVSSTFIYSDGTLKSRNSETFSNASAVATTPSGYYAATTYSSSIYTTTLTTSSNLTYGIITSSKASCPSLTTTSTRTGYYALTTMSLRNTVSYLAGTGNTICALNNNSETTATTVNKNLSLNLNGKTIKLGAQINVTAGSLNLINTSSTSSSLSPTGNVKIFNLSSSGSLYVDAANTIKMDARSRVAVAIANSGTGVIAIDGKVNLNVDQANAIQSTSTGNIYLGYNQGSNSTSSDSSRPQISYCNVTDHTTCGSSATVRITGTGSFYMKYANILQLGEESANAGIAINHVGTSGTVYIYDAAYIWSAAKYLWTVRTSAGASVVLGNSNYYDGKNFYTVTQANTSPQKWTIGATAYGVGITGGGSFTMNGGIIRTSSGASSYGTVYVDGSTNTNTFKDGWIYTTGSTPGVYIKDSAVKFTASSSSDSGISIYSAKGQALYFTSSSGKTANLISGYFLTNSSTADVAAIQVLGSNYKVNINTGSNYRNHDYGVLAASHYTQAFLALNSGGTVNIGSTSFSSSSSYPKDSNSKEYGPVFMSFGTTSTFKTSSYTSSKFTLYTPSSSSNKATVNFYQGKVYHQLGSGMYSYPDNFNEKYSNSSDSTTITFNIADRHHGFSTYLPYNSEITGYVWKQW